jgi:hypothetical protein
VTCGYSLVLPYVRPLISANEARSRTHWRTQNATKAQVHADVLVLVRAGKVPPLAKGRLLLSWTPPDRRIHDADGLSWLLKACADGLVAAGVFPDDNSRVIDRMSMEITPPEKPGRMVLHIEDRSAA